MSFFFNRTAGRWHVPSTPTLYGRRVFCVRLSAPFVVMEGNMSPPGPLSVASPLEIPAPSMAESDSRLERNHPRRGARGMRPLRGRQSYFAKLHILAQPRNRATLRGKDREFPAEDTLLKSWEPMTFVDENQESFVRLLMGEHCRESWWSW